MPNVGKYTAYGEGWITGHPWCTAKCVYHIKTMGDITPTTYGEGCLLHKIHVWQYTNYIRRRVFITKKKNEKKHEWHYTHDVRRRVFYYKTNKKTWMTGHPRCTACEFQDEARRRLQDLVHGEGRGKVEGTELKTGEGASILVNSKGICWSESPFCSTI